MLNIFVHYIANSVNANARSLSNKFQEHTDQILNIIHVENNETVSARQHDDQPRRMVCMANKRDYVYLPVLLVGIQLYACMCVADDCVCVCVLL